MLTANAPLCLTDTVTADFDLEFGNVFRLDPNAGQTLSRRLTPAKNFAAREFISENSRKAHGVKG